MGRSIIITALGIFERDQSRKIVKILSAITSFLNLLKQNMRYLIPTSISYSKHAQWLNARPVLVINSGSNLRHTSSRISASQQQRAFRSPLAARRCNFAQVTTGQIILFVLYIVGYNVYQRVGFLENVINKIYYFIRPYFNKVALIFKYYSLFNNRAMSPSDHILSIAKHGYPLRIAGSPSELFKIFLCTGIQHLMPTTPSF